MSNKYLALIPARAGSIGLPDKNILKIESKSLIQRSIDSAVENQFISHVYISSDSQKYLDEIEPTNKVIKVLRDGSAATSTATANLVAFDFLENHEISLDSYIIYLQPTSAMRTAHHISAAIKILEDQNRTSLVSVVKSSEHPLKCLEVNNGKLSNFLNSSIPTANRQSLPQIFHPNGAIYIFQVKEFIKRKDIPIEGAIPFYMSKRDSVDIDEQLDYEIAKFLWETNEF